MPRSIVFCAKNTLRRTSKNCDTYIAQQAGISRLLFTTLSQVGKRLFTAFYLRPGACACTVNLW